MKLWDKIYVAIVALAALGLTVVFTAFPRSVVSELEKRELATFPAFSLDSLANGSFTADVSTWFSDSEPYRDRFMELSMHVKDWMRLVVSEDHVTFHASENQQDDTDMEADINLDELTATDSMETDREIHVGADENAKIANAGIIVMGTGANVRALMAYGGTDKGGVPYAKAANLYKETFGENVNVYCMVIPTAVEYYCPENIRKHTKPERPTIKNIHEHLDPGVKAVDIYNELADHASENIYLRTDHHWAPLGAYYAAEKFAKVAGVPFHDLSSYDCDTVHGFVGSMYGYSKDISVKEAPEDFIYYKPRDVEYNTTYVTYTINDKYQVTGEGRPQKGPFFYHVRNGSGAAYSTFMGTDTRLTQVRTSVKNGRRLIILKDSFGNALPGYLFYSFEEIHVIDSRYFTKNLVQYVEENKITDILFANNIFKAYSNYILRDYSRFLTQEPGVHQAKPAKKDTTNQPDKNEQQPKAEQQATTPDQPKQVEPTEQSVPTEQTVPSEQKDTL